MKKLSALILVLSLALWGCAPAAAAPSQAFVATASFYPVYALGGGMTEGIPGFEVNCMAPAQSGCLHDYQLTTADLKSLAACDLFIINGLGMEAFLTDVQQQLPNLAIADLSRGITPLPGIEGDNPHIWMSLDNAMLMVNNLAQDLGRAHPQNSAHYAQTGADYIKRLNGLKKQYQTALAGAEGTKAVVFHESLCYLLEEWGFDVLCVIQQDEHDAPSAARVAEVIELVKSQSSAVLLFTEPQYQSPSADAIALETGAKIYELDTLVTASGDSATAYIDVMKANLAVLEAALS